MEVAWKKTNNYSIFHTLQAKQVEKKTKNETKQTWTKKKATATTTTKKHKKNSPKNMGPSLVLS